MKMNLPVLIIKQEPIFPHSETKIEFESSHDKEILSLSETYYNNRILVIYPKDIKEENPDINDLPKIGVFCEIRMKMQMPNGKLRVLLVGIKRSVVLNYSKEDDLIEGVISDTFDYDEDAKLERAYMGSLTKMLNNYIELVPSSSNSILSSLGDITRVDELTDLICIGMNMDGRKKLSYIEELNPYTRADMLLKDMNEAIEISAIEDEIESKLSQEISDSQKEYILREKIRLIREELGDAKDKESETDSLRNKINNLGCSDKIRDDLLDEVSKYENTPQSSPEYSMIRSYLDWFLDLPWNNETVDEKDIKVVKERLNESHYALEKVKTRILEYIAVKENSNSSKSPIICLVGPPGVGKTSLAMSIAKSLNRNYTKISVGGVSDEAEIVGHRRTYIGSLPGLIIQGMKKAKSINPVFIIDEIDKMTKGINGDPASALLEVLDPEQNSKFMDHYLDEEYDLSKVMFITTAYYIDQIPIELLDRLEVVEVSSYTEYEKLDIAKLHLIPRNLEEHGLTKKDVKITDTGILTIIRNYTKEAGVRDLDRMISAVLRKVVMNKLMNKDDSKKTINSKNINEYLGEKKFLFNSKDNESSIGVVNGLAYTSFGGDLLPIEASLYPGKGDLILTGKLGDVMKESAILSLSYIKAHARDFGIDANIFTDNDIHVHVPEGAVPKDGPSAGVTLTTTLISLFTHTPVSNNIAMTGEMTLRGKILPIGGIREKSLGAHRGGIKTIYLPKENMNDLDDVPKEVKDSINFIPVESYNELYDYIFKEKKPKADFPELMELTFDYN